MTAPYFSITNRRMGKIKRFLFHWRQGRQDKFPICCILRFSIESALEDGKTFYFKDGYRSSAIRRGTIQDGIRSRFVPCGIFHHKTHTYGGKRVRKI